MNDLNRLGLRQWPNSDQRLADAEQVNGYECNQQSQTKPNQNQPTPCVLGYWIALYAGMRVYLCVCVCVCGWKAMNGAQAEARGKGGKRRSGWNKMVEDKMKQVNPNHTSQEKTTTTKGSKSLL